MAVTVQDLSDAVVLLPAVSVVPDRLIRMTFHDYKQNRQALKDLASGKETDAVKEFLKRYEIVPKNNQQSNVQTKEEEKAMAKNLRQK